MELKNTFVHAVIDLTTIEKYVELQVVQVHKFLDLMHVNAAELHDI